MSAANSESLQELLQQRKEPRTGNPIEIASKSAAIGSVQRMPLCMHVCLYACMSICLYACSLYVCVHMHLDMTDNGRYESCLASI